MRRFTAVVFTASLVLVAAAGPAGADVQKLVIKDPGFVLTEGCQAGEEPCEGSAVRIHLVIKCPVEEFFTLFVLVKQDETEGTSQVGGECSGDGLDVFVAVFPDQGPGFQPGRAKVKASAFSDPGGVGGASDGVFDVNTDKRITLVETQCFGAAC